MAAKSNCKLSAEVEKYLVDKGFSKMPRGTWLAHVEDLTVCLRMLPVHSQVAGHLARPGLTAATDAPFSPTWAVAYRAERGEAVKACARHLLNMVEEHLLAGTIPFQRVSSFSHEYVVIDTLT